MVIEENKYSISVVHPDLNGVLHYINKTPEQVCSIGEDVFTLYGITTAEWNQAYIQYGYDNKLTTKLKKLIRKIIK